MLFWCEWVSGPMCCVVLALSTQGDGVQCSSSPLPAFLVGVGLRFPAVSLHRKLNFFLLCMLIYILCVRVLWCSALLGAGVPGSCLPLWVTDDRRDEVRYPQFCLC